MITESEHRKLLDEKELEIENAKELLEQLEDELETIWQMEVEEDE